MTSRPYTVDQLLNLRANRAPAGLASLADKDPGLADMLRGSGNGVHTPVLAANSTVHHVAAVYPTAHQGVVANSTIHPGVTASSKPAVQKITDDSSTGSEEIVYKGNPARRGVSQETEWKFRGRSESDLAVTEPLPAPTGLNAQQNEGFQRFYKAVVSPTHVRVTAGGRIVPNTRGSSSPTAKRTKDKGAVDMQNDNGQAAQPQAEGMMKVPGVPIFASMPPNFYPPFHPQFSHLGTPMPMMSVPMGMGMPGGYQFQQPPVNGVANALLNLDSSLKENQSKKAEDSQATQSADDGKANDKIKISPPEHFDHSKPFIYNGQLMYPMPPFPPPIGGPYMPPGFTGPPGYPVPSYAAPMMAPPHVAMNPALVHIGYAPQAAPSSRSASVGNVNPTAPGPAVALKPPSAPPISSIRPSDISRKQIDSLRNSLKYHEDQLQYNRHQIDEKDMEKSVKMLQEQIGRFENMHQGQLAYEEKYYPKRDNPKDSTPTTTTPSPAGISTSGSFFAPPQPQEMKDDAAPQVASAVSSLRRPGFRSRPGINTSQNSQAAFGFDPLAAPAKLNDPVKKSSLPTGAALAPPFQPRKPSGLDPQLMDESNPADHPMLSDQVHGSAEKRLLSAGASSWASWGMQPVSSISNGASEHNVDQASFSPDHENLGRPYLVGTLPTGANAQTAKDADYLYERELTEDELRARFLHWGKAPWYARQGLPKYDGKNFYPASPIKYDQRLEPKQRTPPSMADAGYTFEPVMVDAADPFRPSTPVNGVKLSKRVVSKENTPPKQVEDKGIEEGRRTSRAVTASENDARSSDYEESRLGHSAGRLHNMLKRGITRSTDVLPSAVTSTTAQGFLPQYTGHGSLVASLSPVMVSPESPTRPSPRKSPESGGALLTPITDKHGENRRLPLGNVGPLSLEEQFRNIVSLDAKHRAALPSHWKAA